MGMTCAARLCKNKSYNCNKSFFRFPSNVARARIWVVSCGREDLLENLGKLHSSYRLCQDHFEDKMFMNQNRKRLTSNAIPTLFPVLEGSSRGSHLDHSYTPLYELPCLDQGKKTTVPKIAILQDITIPPDSSAPVYVTTENTVEDEVLPELLSPSSSTQTTSDLSFHTPRKQKYKETIQILKTENASLKRQLQQMEHRFDNIENFLSIEQFCKLTHKFCGNDDLARFVNIQISQSKKKPRGRRYSYEFKLECLSLYCTGPKLYKQVLVKKYCLPTPRTLLKLLKGVKVSPGLDNPQLFEILRRKVNYFVENKKYCIICIDEMSIKAHLFYNRGTDCVIGLSEGGDGGNVFKPALSASVIMVRGIFSRWKQPVAFNFCHSAYPAESLKHQIFELIKILKHIGLKICAVTTDMGSNYMPLSKLLGVTASKPYFFCEGQKVYYIFDVPHVIKAIRNMLMKYDFLIGNDKISWSFIKIFYEHDKNYPIRAAPKLTKSHIYPNSFEKMKTKYATQVFSETVACGMNVYIRFRQLPSQAYKTSEFVSNIDKVFDVLNSSCTKSSKLYNRAFKGLPHQTQLLKEFLALIDQIEVKDNKGKNIKNLIKSFKCIKISINSILLLWDDLKELEVKYLLTRRLNQDCLENFFGSVRQQNGNCRNPTPVQFQGSFRKLMYLKLYHAGTENCEADPDSVLLQLKDISSDTISPPSPPPFTNQLIDPDYQQHDLLQKNFERYVCGYVLNKVLKIHSCGICISYANEQKDLDDTSLYIYFKAFENAEVSLFGRLNNPSDGFVNFMNDVETIFQQKIETFILKPLVCQNLFEMANELPFLHPCDSFPKEYAVKLYLRVRLYYTLKNINRNFRDQKYIKNKLIILRNL